MSLTKVSYSMINGAVINVLDYGADPTGVADSTAAIQAAMDENNIIYFPAGTYKTTAPLDFKNNGTRIIGAGRALTTINYTGTVTAFRNPDSATITRLFCSIENMKIQATTSGASGIVIDWKSMQFGQLLNLWVVGQSVLGNVAINLEAVWVVTEATYNVIQGCYVGLTSIGLRIRDGANSNLIQANRFQTSVSTGSGIILSGSAPGYVSNNTIIANGFEFPGAINVGINVFQNTDSTVIIGNRFESLQSGIVVGATNVKFVSAEYSKNYFDSCLVNINNASGATATQHAIIAAASVNGSGGAIILGNSFNLSVVRNSAGNYTFTFLTALPNSTYVISVESSQKFNLITGKTATTFTVETQDATQTAADAATLDVSVIYNR
jgi:hypothetical protein